MKTNHYESVVIINAALEDEQIDSIISRIEEFIKSNEGSITDIDKWGRKRLAYPIQKSKSGYYVVLRFKSERDFIAKLERTFRLDETIIRYLTVVLDKRALQYIEDEKNRQEGETASSDGQEKSTQSNNESTE
ncbi:MAG: 30S ribosomal protein S6 [Melioribacteraceae bacterium]|nr:30S ribosomal protein S6 [Melioribacteraceae bacterium]